MITSRRYYAVLLLIALVGLGARAFHMHTPEGSDDAMYRVAATELFGPHLAKFPTMMYYARIGIGTILRAWFTLFGTGLYVTAPLLLVLSLTSLVLFAAACRLVMDQTATLVASALYWLHPIAIQFDGVLEADEFAMPFLLAAFLFFMLYLTRARSAYLLPAGIFAGLVILSKEYYVLIVLPFAIAILRDPAARGSRLSRLVLLAMGVVCGMAADPVLNYLDSGNPLAHISGVNRYGELQATWERIPEFSLKQAASSLIERGAYLEYLLQDFGVAGGIALVSGWAYLFCKRRSLPCAVALAAATVFFAFLSFTPVKFRPLIFAEVQPRYTLVLLPFLAFGAGPLIAGFFNGIADATLRKLGVFALALLCALNCCVPNTRIGRVRVLECRALINLMKEKTAWGATTIVCPQNYRTLILDQMIAPGFTFKYAKERERPVIWHEFGDIPEEWLDEPATGFFVPVTAIERAPVVAPGENRAATADDVPDPRPALARAGFEAHELRVPDTSTRTWLARLGIPLKGKRIGWFYVRPVSGETH